MIDDVLTLAREGQTVTETAPVDLAAVATEAWENVDTADATLSVDADVRVEADRSRLLRLFENLYRNAIEHGSTGSQNGKRSGDSVEHGGEAVSVTVHATGQADDGGRCTFSVIDDGPGIPPEERDRVLEDGFTTSEDGTGLGLSIVRSIVEAHGWSIAVEAGPEGGASFVVSDVRTVEE